MKKYTFYTLILALIVISTSCKQKDQTVPRIYFDGEIETSQRWVLQEYYTLPKATASDNVDGDLTSAITVSHTLTFYETRSDSVEGSTVYLLADKKTNGMEGYVGRDGNYTITYSATDEAGNTGTKTISVSVKNSLINWATNSSGENLTYQMKREKISGYQEIGGIYTKDVSGVATNQDDIFDYDGVAGKPVETTIKVDRIYNYRLSLSKLGVINSCKFNLDFNRFSQQINFPLPETLVIGQENVLGESDLTDFLYVISEIGTSNYGDYQFSITYQIERYREGDVTYYDYIYPDTPGDERYWVYDNKKSTYKETYIKK
jgi:hypothetical protein